MPTIISESIETTPIPTPASLPTALAMLGSPAAEDRIVAAQVLPIFGPDAQQAIPALIANLSYPHTSDVRRAAALALGWIGPPAEAALPALVQRLHDPDTAVQERREAIVASQRIGNPRVMPELAARLYDAEDSDDIETADAMGVLAHQSFPDQGGPGYRSAPDGTPLIVAAARAWWEQTGKQQDWGAPVR